MTGYAPHAVDLDRLQAINAPDVAAAANATLQPADGNFEIHVKFNNHMWWAMPRDLSDGLLELWRGGENNVSYVWDWEGTRPGSYVNADGEETPYNRYTIDFATMQQRNSDRTRFRAIKIVQVLKAE